MLAVSPKLWSQCIGKKFWRRPTRPLFKMSNRSTSTQRKITNHDKAKLFGVGIGASLTQGILGCGHGVAINFGTRSVLNKVPMSVVVGTGAFAFLGTGTSMITSFIASLGMDEQNISYSFSLLNEDTVYVACCLGITGTFATPLGVHLGKKLPNHLLSGIMGLLFCCVSPFILNSAWTKYSTAQERDDKQMLPNVKENIAFEKTTGTQQNTITMKNLKLGASRFYDLIQTVPERALSNPWETSIHGAIGIFGGLLYGVAGVGPILMTYLTMATPFVHAQCVVAAMLAHFPRVLVGVASHLQVGNVAKGAVFPLIVGTSIGGLYGANVLTSAPEALLKGIFGTIVGIVGVRQVHSMYKVIKKIK
jgi:uncharacterized membrane protein YfcA